MRKKFLILTLILATLCCIFVVSCSGGVEDLDHIHNYVERIFKPDCTKDGRVEKICTVCGDIVVLSATPANGHNPNEWQIKTEATCTANKVEERICRDCGAVVETKVSPVDGHTAGEWQVTEDATCTQRLIECKYCKVCGEEVDRRVGNKLNHDYTQITVPGTCAVSEHMLFTCKLCGESHTDNYTDIYEAHTEGIWIVESAPTCVSDGVRKKICGVCSKVLDKAEAIPMDPNNHSFLVETFPPVNGEEGYTKHTCKSCNYEVINVYETNLLPSQVYEMIVSATVRIESCNKKGEMHNMGSGFFINENGELVTNYHVIAGAYQVKVKLYGGTEYYVTQILGYDAAKDIAILKIDLAGNSYLKIASDSVKTGDPVYALGSPLGVDDIFSDGVVSNPSKYMDGINFITFTAPISNGSSGGPLVNARGEVVGINSQVAKKGQNLNFAVPTALVSAIDTTSPKAPSEVYLETFDICGTNVLTYYIILNGEAVDVNGRYVITKTLLEETSTSYGRELRLEYNDETKEVTVSVSWIDSGKDLYTFELVLDGVKKNYNVRFFDHVWSQYTMEGKLDTSVQVISTSGVVNESLVSEIFSFDFINYKTTSNDSLTVKNAKTLFGMAYVYILEGLDEILLSSDTDLTLDVFNFKLPETQIPSEQ